MSSIGNLSGSSGAASSAAYRNVQLVIGIGLMPLVCLAGIVGNVFCVLVLVKPKMRTSTNIYLLLLAFGDLIKLVNDLMYTVSVICKYYSAGGDNLIYVNYYQFGYFLSQYSSAVASWLTVAVAFERFLMVVFPTACRGALTVAKATVACVVISVVVLMVTAPICLRYQKVPVPGTNGSELQQTLGVTDLWLRYFAHSYSNFQSSFRCIAPLAILIVLNACIIVNVRKTRANRRLAARNRITLMLIIVIFIFIVFALPDAAMTLYGIGYHEVETDAQRIVREITDLLLTLNSAHNFFLYMFFNSIFFEVCLESYCGCMNSERKARLIHSQSQRDRGRRENNNDEADDVGELEAARNGDGGGGRESEELVELQPKNGRRASEQQPQTLLQT